MNEYFLDFPLWLFVYEFLVEGDDSLAECLSNRVNLWSITSSSHSDSNVQIGEFLSSQKEKRFLDFWSHCLLIKLELLQGEGCPKGIRLFSIILFHDEQWQPPLRFSYVRNIKPILPSWLCSYLKFLNLILNYLLLLVIRVFKLILKWTLCNL